MQDDFNAASNPRQFVPSEFIEKYPTLGIALDEQAPFLHLMKPETYQSMQPRIIQLYEDGLGDEDPVIREALMVSAIYNTSPRPLEKPSYLALTYGADAAVIIRELDDTDFKEVGTHRARLMTAMMIWDMERQIDLLKTGGSEAWIDFMREENTKKWDRDEMHEILFADLASPYLEVTYIKTERALLLESGILSPPRRPGFGHN